MENFEWSNEYFGLKNKEGQNVILIIDNNPYKHPHPIIKVEVIGPIPDLCCGVYKEPKPDKKKLPESKIELEILLNGMLVNRTLGQSVSDYLDKCGY